MIKRKPKFDKNSYNNQYYDTNKKESVKKVKTNVIETTQK